MNNCCAFSWHDSLKQYIMLNMYLLCCYLMWLNRDTIPHFFRHGTFSCNISPESMQNKAQSFTHASSTLFWLWFNFTTVSQLRKSQMYWLISISVFDYSIRLLYNYSIWTKIQAKGCLMPLHFILGTQQPFVS